MISREPDRDQLEQFVDALLRYRGTEGFLSLRSFLEHDDKAPAFRITPVSLKGNFKFLMDCVVDDARRAAQAPKPVVFAPPVCVFHNKYKAGEKDVLAGLCVSAELDRNPHEALRQLEELLGPATLVVKSGGTWVNPETGEIEDKLHAYWRLAAPAVRIPDDDLPAPKNANTPLVMLKSVRASAARLVGGDGTGVPINHPYRWAGSLHRKAEPRLCSIATIRADVEITLADAIKALPAPPAETGQGHGVEYWRTKIDPGQRFEGSQRGSEIASIAGKLLRHHDVPFTLSLMRCVNAAKCEPPLPDFEIVGIVASVARKEDARRTERWDRYDTDAADWEAPS